jgi:spermidine/putrescine transport system ATP-binding protein
MMHVTGEHDVVNKEAHERISASSFMMDLEDVASLSDGEVIARANAQAWTDEDEDVSLTEVEYDVKEEVGVYDCTFGTSAGTKITIKINVVKPRAVEDAENEESIQAFDFYRTVDEIKESVALDTDLIRWADAYAWSTEDNTRVEIWDVKYDFDDQAITEGDYPITFSTQGRELKIETTDKHEVGERVGLMWNPEDIHVMKKMG